MLALLCSLTAVPVAAGQLGAQLEWSQRVVLSTPVSGVVAEVLVRPGELVQAGQLLLRFDQRPFRSVLEERKAQVDKQRLLRDEAQRELERNRELYARTVISVHDRQLAEIAAAAAQSDYAAAVAALQAAELDLEYSSLQAPFAGIVLQVPAVAGASVINTQQATPLVVLAQQHPMHARAAVSADRLAGLDAGRQATVLVNGARFVATLLTVGAEPDADGNYPLTFSFDPGESVLQAGLPAQVELRE